MSLATRCAACGTVFRVVEDQLKVSEGWVRCGRCQEVFNALPNLFDLDRDAPPPWPGNPAAPAAEPPHSDPAWDRTRPVPRGVATRIAAGAEDAMQADTGHFATQPLLRTASRDTAPQEQDAEQQETGFEDARFNEALLHEEDGEEGVEVFSASQLHPISPPELNEAPPPQPLPRIVAEREMPRIAPADEPPRFVREAELAARWQHPLVRTGLLLLALVSGALLVIQATVHGRDELAARWPASRAMLTPLCAAFSCRIEAPRHLDTLAVDASGLTQLPAPGQYRLSVVLRNRGHTPVLLPVIELTLNDAQGELIARRALAASEMGASQDSLAPGAELPLQAAFTVGDLRVVGYTVEIFYP